MVRKHVRGQPALLAKTLRGRRNDSLAFGYLGFHLGDHLGDHTDTGNGFEPDPSHVVDSLGYLRLVHVHVLGLLVDGLGLRRRERCSSNSWG